MGEKESCLKNRVWASGVKLSDSLNWRLLRLEKQLKASGTCKTVAGWRYNYDRLVEAW
jgi:hypothetical protein